MTGPLTIDSELDADQIEAVQAAVDLWSEATGGRFAPELRFGPVECEDPFAIEAVHAQGCLVGQRVQSGDGSTGQVLGATDPDQHSVAVAAWLDGDGFRNTVAHEIGHYLLLGHGDGIMAQLRERRSTSVTASTIDEFCDVWGC